MYCKNIRDKVEPIALTLLRVVAGYILFYHGWLKLQDFEGTVGLMTNLKLPAPEFQAVMAIACELLGGLGLMVGLLTPVACLGIVAAMGVAVFHVHWKNGLLGKNGGFEYPLTLLCVGLFFMFRGAGCISLDGLIEKKLKKPSLS